MGAKGLVLNHSTIAWKQISLCFRGIAEDALSLSTVVGSWPALGQASLFPQPGCDHKMFSHEEWHSQLASGELSSSSTPRTTSHYCSAVAGACSPRNVAGQQAPCWGENPAPSPAGKSRMETRDWFCWEAASPDLPDPTSPEHARGTAPRGRALYQGHLMSPPATMPSSRCTAPCCPDTNLFLATRDKQAWD